MATSKYLPRVLLYVVITFYVTAELRAWEVYDGACYARMTRCYFPVIEKYRPRQYSSPFEESCYGR